MKNIINVSHIVISLSFQLLFFLLTKNLFLGVVASFFFFAGREIAQTEYRHIESLPSKLRADMPATGGLNPKFWTPKSFFADLFIPSAITVLIAYLF